MLNLINYVYYRIASVFWNTSSWGRSTFHGYTLVVLETCIIFNALLIISFFRYAISGVFPSETIDFFIKRIYVPLMIVSIIIIPSKDKKTYKKLENKYQNDKYKEIKGWLIVIYCVLSFFSIVILSCVY